MSAISGIGVNTGTRYERPDPIKQHMEAARETQKAEDRVEKRDENIEVLQARREQIKAPVVNGQGEKLDIEA